eukprot:6180973-Pleurochrysis_carterae.AAC.2
MQYFNEAAERKICGSAESVYQVKQTRTAKKVDEPKQYKQVHMDGLLGYAVVIGSSDPLAVCWGKDC